MKGGTMYNQKDIVLAPFPYSDLTSFKQRPMLIVSNGKMDKTQDVICCLLTSNPSADGIPVKKKDVVNGKMPFESKVKPYRIFTIDKRIIKKKVCEINSGFYKEIFNEIKSYIN